MPPRKRLVVLISIMAVVTVSVEAVTIRLLYQTALAEERERLQEIAKSQARLIEAIARFDRKYSRYYSAGARAASLSQVLDAHRHYEGFGETGEFTLAQKNGDHIDFLLSHRHYDFADLKPVPLESPLAQPMHAALEGQSGTMIGPDYRGTKVLASYEPVAELDLGIVAKIDMEEIRKPFIRASMISGAIGIVVIAAGAGLFLVLTNPLIEKLGRTNEELQSTLSKVKQLSGMLPICASCKKIRDDKGYWKQIEIYIRDHSEVEFSHGLCPDCAKRLYPGHSFPDSV